MLIQGFLEASLVGLESTAGHDILVLLLGLLGERFVLEESLFEYSSEPQTLIGEGLDFTVVLARLAHLDVLLQLFALALLHLVV